MTAPLSQPLSPGVLQALLQTARRSGPRGVRSWMQVYLSETKASEHRRLLLDINAFLIRQSFEPGPQEDAMRVRDTIAHMLGDEMAPNP